MRRGVPAIRVGGRLVTTVLDLMLATYGVARDGLPGEWPEGYDDADAALHAGLAGGDHRASTASLAVKVAREFARNAEVSGGRSMICMGAGTNHWFHSDETYRVVHRAAAARAAASGINGGGWAHYVGQEKIRTFAGWQTLAFALDWRAPAAPGAGHVVVLHAHRAVALRPPAARSAFASPLGARPVRRAGPRSTRTRRRCGWAGCRRIPTFDRNPLDLADEAAARPASTPAEHVVAELQGRAGCASRSRTPSAPVELPARVLRLALEPARLLGQGPGVLPAPPARRRRTTVRWPRSCAEERAPDERALARRDARAASSTCWSTSTSG